MLRPPALLALFALTLVAGCSGGADEPPGDIAFSVNDGGWNEIWVMAADGSERTRLTDTEPPENDAAGSAGPAWSPDGSRIAFAAQVGTLEEDQRLTEIYVMRSDGTDKRRLTTNETVDASPSWSSDGAQLAFTRIVEPGSATARSGIFVLDADGGNERRLTGSAVPSFDYSPAWSPDGSEIVFVRAELTSSGARGGIYVVSAAGGAPRKLTDDGSEPAWSPDGTRIVFTSTRDGFGQTCFHECGPSGEIYVLDLETGDTQRLTETGANDSSPAWSPDGTAIAFSSDRSNPEQHEIEIYVMRATGEDVRRLTRNDVWDGEPAWRP